MSHPFSISVRHLFIVLITLALMVGTQAGWVTIAYAQEAHAGEADRPEASHPGSRRLQ